MDLLKTVKNFGSTFNKSDDDQSDFNDKINPETSKSPIYNLLFIQDKKHDKWRKEDLDNQKKFMVFLKGEFTKLGKIPGTGGKTGFLGQGGTGSSGESGEGEGILAGLGLGSIGRFLSKSVKFAGKGLGLVGAGYGLYDASNAIEEKRGQGFTEGGLDSRAGRYGEAALSGAGAGAFLGSFIPLLGTTIGAVIGGLGGLATALYSDTKEIDKNAATNLNSLPDNPSVTKPIVDKNGRYKLGYNVFTGENNLPKDGLSDDINATSKAHQEKSWLEKEQPTHPNAASGISNSLKGYYNDLFGDKDKAAEYHQAATDAFGRMFDAKDEKNYKLNKQDVIKEVTEQAKKENWTDKKRDEEITERLTKLSSTPTSDLALNTVDYSKGSWTSEGGSIDNSNSYDGKNKNTNINNIISPELNSTIKNGPWTNTGKDGLDFTQSHEINKKVPLKPYADAGGQSIGYGHFIKPGEDYSKGITQEQAAQLYQEDRAKAEVQVRKQIPNYDNLNKNQQDALIDQAYNAGHIGKKIANEINSGDLESAGKDLSNSIVTSQGVINPVLIKRRQEESQLFSSPITNKDMKNDIGDTATQNSITSDSLPPVASANDNEQPATAVNTMKTVDKTNNSSIIVGSGGSKGQPSIDDIPIMIDDFGMILINTNLFT